MFPLAEREDKLDISQMHVSPDTPAPVLAPLEAQRVARLAERITAARDKGKPVMLTYGAHLIKNGLGPVLIRLIEEGWVTHLATNGAGSIHDWEFAFQGTSSEDVRDNVARGRFGTWDETGRAINLSVAAGGVDGLGYGWSVGRFIAEDGTDLPEPDAMRAAITASLAQPDERLGALADLLYVMSSFGFLAGRHAMTHRFKEYSVQCAAYKLGVPFTVHPGVGYDIIYTHPLNCGGAIGRGAVRDFLAYAESISRLSDGVHLTVGSAIMAPMIFEKSLSMANNLALTTTGAALHDYDLVVNDIQEGGDWDWNQGEPPMEHPAYYLRFCKTFYRMGGTLDYICLDNRAFLLALYGALRGARVG
jgi:hypothetical protein